MIRKRSSATVGIVCLGIVGLLIGASQLGLVRASAAKANAKATIITVTAGKPSELAFKLSKLSSLPLGALTFKVKNSGLVPHDFKVCSIPAKSSAKNACVGKTTKLLKPGQSAILTVTLTKKGTYEFLCSVPGHAAGGMKGLIGVGVVVPTTAPTTTTKPKTTTPATTTTPVTPPPATEALIGDPTAGGPLFISNCGSCHVLAAAGTKGAVGPSLDVTAPDQALIVTQVTNGGLGMPSFGGTLTAAQINNLAAYVYQSTHR